MAEHLVDKAWVAAFEKPKTDPSAFEKPATTVLSPYLKFGQVLTPSDARQQRMYAADVRMLGLILHRLRHAERVRAAAAGAYRLACSTRSFLRCCKVGVSSE
jgi:hypothetical protein